MSARPARQQVTQRQVAKAAAVSRTAVAVVLNGDTSARISAATRAHVLRVAKRLGYDRANLRRIHRRGSPRVEVNLDAAVRVVTSSGSVHSTGRGRVRTLNASGLLFDSPRLRPATLPLDSFVIHIAIDHGPLEGFAAACEPVSFSGKGAFGIGARFLRLRRADAARLSKFLKPLERRR